MAWKSMGMCTVEETLYSGTYSCVFRVNKKMDGKEYAIKEIRAEFLKTATDDDKRLIEEDANVAIAMNHPNIIRVFGNFVENGSIFQVMEYCESTLRKEIDRAQLENQYFPEDQLYSWAKQMASAIRYLNDSGIRHGNVSPHNFLLLGPKKDIRLSDFAMSRPLDMFNTENPGNVTGTVLYMSPEAMQQKPLSEKCDTWAFGCCLYELATLKPLFLADNLLNFIWIVVNFKSIAIERRALLVEANVKTDLINFLDFTMNSDVNQRPTMAAVCEHNYLGELPRLFISYSRKNKELTMKVRDKLTAWGFDVWIDEENMHGNLTDAMAEGIENASIVLICFSEDYARSRNCKLEADYCIQLDKPFVPLKMQKDYKPKGWLGICLGSKLFFDFSKEDRFDETASRLVDELRHIGRFPTRPDGLMSKPQNELLTSSTSRPGTEKRPRSILKSSKPQTPVVGTRVEPQKIIRPISNVRMTSATLRATAEKEALEGDSQTAAIVKAEEIVETRRLPPVKPFPRPFSRKKSGVMLMSVLVPPTPKPPRPNRMDPMIASKLLQAQNAKRLLIERDRINVRNAMIRNDTQLVFQKQQRGDGGGLSRAPTFLSSNQVRESTLLTTVPMVPSKIMGRILHNK